MRSRFNGRRELTFESLDFPIQNLYKVQFFGLSVRGSPKIHFSEISPIIVKLDPFHEKEVLPQGAGISTGR